MGGISEKTARILSALIRIKMQFYISRRDSLSNPNFMVDVTPFISFRYYLAVKRI